MDQPLISFYVIAFNQERYIRQAVEAAFRQTWSPLEIILSDDNSEDRTFEIMREMAQSYRGPHRLILNRNSRNLGVGAHINRIVELCSGEFIVASAGDDVSAPERAEKLYRLYLSTGKRAFLVYSNLIEIDEEGRELRRRDFSTEVPSGTPPTDQWSLEQHIQGCTPPVHGAAFGWSRELYDWFGPLFPGVVFEDNVLNWRAEGVGCVALHPECLVRHRNHSTQLTNLYSPAALRKAVDRRRCLAWSDVVTLRQNLEDTEVLRARGFLSADLYERARRYLLERLKVTEYRFHALYGSYGVRLKQTLTKPRQLLAQDRPLRTFLYAVTPHPVLRALYATIAACRSRTS